MADHDPFAELHRFTEAGEQARPLPAERVRALGTRRRQRRHALVAGTAFAAAVLVGGGVLFGSSGLARLDDPPVAVPVTSTPAAPSPTPRTLGAANLIPADEVPNDNGAPDWQVAPEGSGRVPDEVSVCIPGSLDVLGATDTATRDYRYPGVEQTPIQTVALQFADAAEATTAERTVQGWVADCAATIVEVKGGTLLDEDAEPLVVEVETPAGTSGTFADLPTYRYQQGESSEDGVFESLGVTRVDDRLMLTVRIVVGMDDNVSLQPGGDPDNGIPAHPQFGLITAAAEALAR